MLVFSFPCVHSQSFSNHTSICWFYSHAERLFLHIHAPTISHIQMFSSLVVWVSYVALYMGTHLLVRIVLNINEELEWGERQGRSGWTRRCVCHSLENIEEFFVADWYASTDSHDHDTADNGPCGIPFTIPWNVSMKGESITLITALNRAHFEHAANSVSSKS